MKEGLGGIGEKARKVDGKNTNKIKELNKYFIGK